MSNNINKKNRSYSPFYLNKFNKLVNNSILLLDTGDAFYGTSFGSSKDCIGELCFNTSKDQPGLFAHGPDENSGRIGLTNGLVILTS